MKMKKIAAALVAAAAMLGSMNAGASMITFETRAITSSFANTDYKAAWDAQASVISSTSLAAFDGQVSPWNSFSHLTVDFDLTSPTSLLFQFGLDAGFGGELRVDGSVNQRRTANLWWNNNWGNTSQILGTSSLLLGAGHHVLTSYWAEDCCSGTQSARFSTDNGATWNTLSVSALDTLKQADVPEPGMLALLGIGFAGLAMSRRKKSA